MSESELESIFYVILIILAIFVYLLPTVIANMRCHSHKIALFLLNLFAGGTGIGWIIAFVWAFMDNTVVQIEEKPTIAQELKELAQLKEQGIITEKEFNIKKDNLLNT